MLLSVVTTVYGAAEPSGPPKPAPPSVLCSVPVEMT
jgi:hypothetical protein